MNKSGGKRIALVGAGGISFGPITMYGAIRASGLRGATLVLIDINPKGLEAARAAGERMNEQMGNPIRIETETDTARGVRNADYVMLSVAVARKRFWKQDYKIPRKYGSHQDMGECGGPGGLFHSLRSIKLVLEICKTLEQNAPDALLLNVTNPLPRVNLAIHRATSLNCIGDCPEYMFGLLRLSLFLGLPPAEINAKAAGLNHFTWFQEIRNARTGQNLYPALRRHVRLFPFMHEKLVQSCFAKYGLYPVSSDSHIGEYLPFTGPGSRSVSEIFPYHRFSAMETGLRGRITNLVAGGQLKLPMRFLPKSFESSILILEALASGATAEFDAVNFINKGYIPNLPDGYCVEVPAKAENGSLIPQSVPPLPDNVARLTRNQYEIHSLIVDSVIQCNPDLALEALIRDPLAPPSRSACKHLFDEMICLQRSKMPF
jgi:alpha-galactosidase